MSQCSEQSARGPTIVLVEPQLGENIGTAARAMANFGLNELRLVNPREGWPNQKARAAASGADHVIDQACVFANVEAAVDDLSFVYAATARERDLAKDVAGPRQAAERLRLLAPGLRFGVLFGPERSGLTNDHVALADEILTLPVDPGFSSLNIAQTVLVVAYEWRLANLDSEATGLPFTGPSADGLAPKAALLNLFEHLEAALDAVNFFRPPEKRPHMVRALRTMLHRARLSEQEVRTLRGVIAALERRPTRPRKSRNSVAAAQQSDEGDR